jgi:acetoacetate decarboxylase
MPNYRIDLILADGQIGQTLLFFCFDDERALAWGSGVKGFPFNGAYPAAEVWEANRLVGRFGLGGTSRE